MTTSYLSYGDNFISKLSKCEVCHPYDLGEGLKQTEMLRHTVSCCMDFWLG